jgi:hypothetical protein
VSTPADPQPTPPPSSPQSPPDRPGADGPAEPTGPATADPAEDPADDPADAEATERLERAVRAVEGALIEFEIAVETFRIEVENFARLHEERLGPLHHHLEELEARIAEAIAARTGDPEDRARAARARADILPLPQVSTLFEGWLESEGIRPDAAAMLTGRAVTPPPRVRPGEQARKLYRELIRACHPDLVTDEAERARRDVFVARVNQAYALGDVDQLQDLAREWAAGPAPEPTPLGRAEELAARLEWLANRKEMLAATAAELEAGAIGSMLRLAEDDPDALLEEIAEDLRGKVAAREAELARLLAEAAAPGQGPGQGPGDAPGGPAPGGE